MLRGVVEGVTGMAYEYVVTQQLLSWNVWTWTSVPSFFQIYSTGRQEAGRIRIRCQRVPWSVCISHRKRSERVLRRRGPVQRARALGPSHCKEDDCLLEEEFRSQIEQRSPYWERNLFWVGLGWWTVPNRGDDDEENSGLTWFHEGSASCG